MRHFASDVFTARRSPSGSDPGPEHDVAVGANVARGLPHLQGGRKQRGRHSGCSEADLELSAEPQALNLRISDNGRGSMSPARPLGTVCSACAGERKDWVDVGRSLPAW